MNWSATGGGISPSPTVSNLRIAVRQRAHQRDMVVTYLTLAALVAGVVWGVCTSL